MDKAATNQLISVSNPSQIAELAGRLAILATLTTILLLATLHVLSPEFSPSWRMVSEYAFGHYAWVLSLMFVSWAISSWALVIVIWSQVHTNAGRVGLWFLIIAGIGEAMASGFDARPEIGQKPPPTKQNDVVPSRRKAIPARTSATREAGAASASKSRLASKMSCGTPISLPKTVRSAGRFDFVVPARAISATGAMAAYLTPSPPCAIQNSISRVRPD